MCLETIFDTRCRKCGDVVYSDVCAIEPSHGYKGQITCRRACGREEKVRVNAEDTVDIICERCQDEEEFCDEFYDEKFDKEKFDEENLYEESDEEDFDEEESDEEELGEEDFDEEESSEKESDVEEFDEDEFDEEELAEDLRLK